MATYFVDSNAVGTDTGVDWPNAYPNTNSLPSPMAAGDIVYIASDHLQTQQTVITGPSGNVTPARIYSVIPSGTTGNSGFQRMIDGGGALRTGAQAIQNFDFNGALECYGLYCQLQQEVTPLVDFLGGHDGERHYFESCDFRNTRQGTGTIQRIAFTFNATVKFKDCLFECVDLGMTDMSLDIGARSRVIMEDCTLICPNSTALIRPLTSAFVELIMRNSNLSQLGVSTPFELVNRRVARVVLEGCKLPASNNYVLMASGFDSRQVDVSVYGGGLDGSANRYSVAKGNEKFQLFTVDHTYVSAAGGAVPYVEPDVATNALSWMVEDSPTTYVGGAEGEFDSPFFGFFDEAGNLSSKVYQFHVLVVKDGVAPVTLTDHQMYIELFALNTTTHTQKQLFTNRPTWPGATAVNYSTTTDNWTYGGGFTTPNKQAYLISCPAISTLREGRVLARLIFRDFPADQQIFINPIFQ